MTPLTQYFKLYTTRISPQAQIGYRWWNIFWGEVVTLFILNYRLRDYPEKNSVHGPCWKHRDSRYSCRLAYLHGWYRCSMLEHICVCESVQCVRIQIHVPDGIAHLLVTITSCCAHNSEYLGIPHLPYFWTLSWPAWGSCRAHNSEYLGTPHLPYFWTLSWLAWESWGTPLPPRYW